ncbi:MAG: chorismate synthase [Candidatus Gastranaerophilales bacterium]|nr:chorismate synthase [Candidatus Gastranaerophilales bacterium]
MGDGVMTKIIRFITAGESHGQALGGIIEGLPCGYELDFDFINSELSARQGGFGRGGRMQIEKDKIKILSGVRFAKTTASPIMFQIENKDWQNWIYPMSVDKFDFEALDEEIKNKIKEKEIIKFRPAHADFAGAMKYDFDDIRNVLERSSARETATRVAIGAICQNILKNYDISFDFDVLQIGECKEKEKFEEYINEFSQKGESLGGIIKITIKNTPIGLGSFVHWDRRLDAQLANALMSIPAIKSVEVGLGKDYALKSGFEAHDEIEFDNKYIHKTNNSGGIEGGMSNGEDIILTVAMKPIPTMKKALNSVEIKTHNKTQAHFERADSCAVEACGVVCKNMCAIIILDNFLQKFGSDVKTDIDLSFENYKKRLNDK